MTCHELAQNDPQFKGGALHDMTAICSYTTADNSLVGNTNYYNDRKIHSLKMIVTFDKLQLNL